MQKKLWNTVCTLMAIVLTAGAQTVDEGKKLFEYERYRSAIEVLKKTVMANPQDVNGWYWLTRSQLAAGYKDSAESSIQQMPADIKTQPLGKVIQGAFLLQKEDSLASLQLFMEAIGTKRKKDPAIQLAVANAIIDAPKGNLYRAIELLQDAADRDKKNTWIYLSIGDAYRKLYNGSEAVKAYQEAIDADSRNAEAYYKIGKIYQTQNNVDVFTEYYTKAIQADPDFAPVYYPLYYYYYFRDVNKALEYLQTYISKTDYSIDNEYMLTDLYYVSKKYNEAIQTAQQVLQKEGDQVKPRIYKLMAYSYDGLEDLTNAEKWMKDYFEKESDTNYVAKDFDLMGKIVSKKTDNTDGVIWYEKAYQLEKDTTAKMDYVKKIMALYKGQKDYAKQAEWNGELYKLNAPFTNVDIFNWGVAYYNAKNYQMSDSVFGIYATKYPDQTFGYYWRARSNAAIDTSMEMGIAIPHYEDMIDVALKDTANTNNKKWLIEAYGYIAAYKVNAEKKYDTALQLYDKILELDPANNDAEKYKEILEKIMAEQAKQTPKETKSSDSKNSF
ncbi:MAG: tetratricopeptide repeat protein [Sediminibacterium sp. Gen4]|jgi:tetratricopeptide (TPR) repeat protein|uniref:tetratricopeptide repeat protein n=1 Tax=unclassified Sediminibacterium TaxID=2635961 RepID=UPI0015BBCC00|nr:MULTISPECIES: tetratricopeptide repeat protein [unclassified Sediminibacterium]MBW0159817.1 tetratricopeptide repeat protein [Sediminibacterium sp.]MBW0163472.1 tetratricopeptide repeat protein [Sediminibacterium sp.]NWK65802.1 tetratricopeptide repeat protein [Sediminibacterium sp. Gen4]